MQIQRSTIIEYFCLFHFGLFIFFAPGCAAPTADARPEKVSYFVKDIDGHEFERQSSSGSLWSEQSPTGLLFLDHKARRVNDIITVKIVESSSAQNEASTKTGKTSSHSGSISSLLGFDTSFGLKTNRGNEFSPSYGAETSDSFNGTGSTSRKGSLQAIITARVIEVLPNGNLVIEGNREVTVNGEKQTIILRGMIRPKDIDSDNTILSTAIAEAQIEYWGRGIVARKQHSGWFTSVLDLLWPF